jgi:hypothetical protein
LQTQARPLDEVTTEQKEALQRQERAVHAAQQAVAGDSNRRKAAVGMVVARIVCRFDTEPTRNGRVRSLLREVTFEPLLGEQICNATDGADRRHCSRR